MTPEAKAALSSGRKDDEDAARKILGYLSRAELDQYERGKLPLSEYLDIVVERVVDAFKTGRTTTPPAPPRRQRPTGADLLPSIADALLDHPLVDVRAVHFVPCDGCRDSGVLCVSCRRNEAAFELLKSRCLLLDQERKKARGR